MRKIIIISYFFPPCNLTAGQRPYSWYIYLHRFGYYPIVITRKWEKQIHTYSDVNQISPPGITIEKQEWGEVHYLPYSGNLRDRIISKYGMGRFSFLRKILSMFELILENFLLGIIPYRGFYAHAISVLKEQKTEGTIISAGPFPQFFFGFLLNKRFSQKWIADYRDDWSTDEVNKGNGIIHGLIKKLNHISEKKWLCSAVAFITISPHYRKKIENFTGIKGYVVQNGFSEIIPVKENALDNHTLVYNGTLYPTQPVEGFLKDLAVFNLASQQKIMVDFPGLGIDDIQKKRVESFASSLDLLSKVNITERVPKTEVIEKQKNALALMMFGHKSLKGIPSSKIYEYLSLGKPIILFEPDGDILEEIVGGYNLGFVIGKPHTFHSAIHEIQSLRQQNKLIPDMDYVMSFSRLNQVKVLADIMDKHF
jgi:glycosyltransferase involved in cell wall biosynthesis